MGDLCNLPETLTINLTEHSAWSLAREGKLRITEEDEEIMFNLSDVCETKNDKDDETDNITNDYAKMSANEKKMQASICHPSGKTSHNDTPGNITQKYPMRVLSRKDGKSKISDCGRYEKNKHTKLLKLIPARKPE